MVTNSISALVLLRSKFVTVKMNISDFRRLCAVFFKAGRSEPRLQKGDLLVLINGRDISEHTHDQVVMFIRASRESHSRQLALLIRRKGEWEKSAAMTRNAMCLFLKINIYYSLELSLQRRFESVGALAAATSCPHTDHPVTGKQATVARSVGAGRHVGGINETAGERDTVRHTLLPFWGISSTNRSQLLDACVYVWAKHK